MEHYVYDLSCCAYIIFILCLLLNCCRCDQYRWVSKGAFTVKCIGNIELKKRSNVIDAKDLGQRVGDTRFRRWEYWGNCNSYSCFFTMHYTGDHSIYKPFPHRATTIKRGPFVCSAPIVKEKVYLM